MHPAWVFMLCDIFGSLWGTLVFSCALLAPGYVTAHITNICGFRGRSLCEQLAWSTVLSLGIGTILTLGAVWSGGARGGAVLLLVFALAAASIAFRNGVFRSPISRGAVPYLLLGCFLCFLAIGSGVDVGLHSRLYMSVTAYDNALRAAFIDAVLRTGVPPASPVYWPGHAAPMHYYYFWYVLCAAVAELAHVSAKQALIASSAWSMFGVLAALALFGRHFLGWRGIDLRRRWWTAVALVSVTGFDGLIALLVFLHSKTVARDIEWWSLDQVSSWADTFLWVPHHAAALVCCLGCLLLLWITIRSTSNTSPWVLSTLAGMSYASAFGLSTYVAVGIVVMALPLAVRECVVGNIRRTLKNCSIACFSAGIFLLPYVFQMLGRQPGARQSAAHTFTLGLRELLPPVVLLGLPGLRTLNATHPYAAKEIAASLLLGPSYLLELGFFAFALIVMQRKQSKTEGERALLFLIWSGLIAVSVVRSQVIAMNDFAIRASLLPQFFLLLIGVITLERTRSLPRLLLVGTVIVGTAGSIYQVLLLRFYMPIHEREGLVEYDDLSHRNYALRAAYGELRKKVAPDARVQFNVPNAGYLGFAQLGAVGRQVIVEDSRCNDSFGGEITPCAYIQKSVAELFAGDQSISPLHSAELCTAIGAQYLVAASWDKAWKQAGNWPWTLPTVVATPDVRIVACDRR